MDATRVKITKPRSSDDLRSDARKDRFAAEIDGNIARDTTIRASLARGFAYGDSVNRAESAKARSDSASAMDERTRRGLGMAGLHDPADDDIGWMSDIPEIEDNDAKRRLDEAMRSRPERIEDLHNEVPASERRGKFDSAMARNGGRYTDDSDDSGHGVAITHREVPRFAPKKVMDTQGHLTRDPEPGREYDERGRLKARSFGEGYQAFKDLIRGKGGR